MIAHSNSPRTPNQPHSPSAFPFHSPLDPAVVASRATPACTECGCACLSRLTIYQLINENYALAKLIPGPFLRVLVRQYAVPAPRRADCDARALLMRPQRATSAGGAASPRITGYLNEYRN